MIFSDSGKPEACEETLSLLAQAPAPEGLAERIQTRLHAAPRLSRWQRIFQTFAHPQVRLLPAVAAALVLLMVAVGWFLARHTAATAPVNANAPQAAPAAQGMSTAGAVRKPQTVQGPAAPQANPLAKSPSTAIPREQNQVLSGR